LLVAARFRVKYFPDICVSAAQRPAQLDRSTRHPITRAIFIRPVIKLKSDDDSFDYATALAVSLFH
jgi:hypothetical protein